MASGGLVASLGYSLERSFSGIVRRSPARWRPLNAVTPAGAEVGPDAPPPESYLASTFGAALELAREGKMELRQAEAFAPLFVRARPVHNEAE